MDGLEDSRKRFRKPARKQPSAQEWKIGGFGGLLRARTREAAAASSGSDADKRSFYPLPPFILPFTEWDAGKQGRAAWNKNPDIARKTETKRDGKTQEKTGKVQFKSCHLDHMS